MGLKPSTSIDGHGIHAFDYRVQINGEPGYTSDTNLVRLQHLTIGYDLNDNVAFFQMWDRDSVRLRSGAVPPQYSLPQPAISDQVEIAVRQTPQADWQVVFRGLIDAVTETKSATGMAYNCRAVMDCTRLNETHITLTANLFNDPVNPQPVFDPESGVLMEAKLKTIYELVEQIMLFKDAWNSTEYFSFQDIFWNGLDASEACGLFVPSDVQFVDTPKGLAIAELLAKAGSYRLHYDPAYGSHGRFVVVKLDLACGYCGDLWDLTYPDVSQAALTGAGDLYAHEADIEEDRTEWTSRSSANVCRITSGPIRFYTGQSIVPEMIENAVDGAGSPVADGSRFRAVENDSIADQKARARNAEGAYYRFQHPLKLFEDARTYQQYPVGMPLFPDWNVHEDYLPDVVMLLDVSPQENIPAGKTGADYLYQSEYQPMTRGQQYAMGIQRLGAADNLHSYQAWKTDGACSACNGSGYVAEVYSGGSNTPTVTWTSCGPDNRFQKLSVTNYLFDPQDFGDPDAYDGMLTPWLASVSQPYPIPWKNLCPVCRGVGLKPQYKIRNLQDRLVSGRANARSMQEAAQEIPLDASYTQVEAETWAQTQNRLTINLSAYVQYEEAILTPHRLPPVAHVNDTWDALGSLAEANRYFDFPHPLTGWTKNLITVAGIAADSPRAKLIDPAWDDQVRVPFTTIMTGQEMPASLDPAMGRVIFNQPVFIPAEMKWQTLRMEVTSAKVAYVLDSDGLVQDQGTQAGNITSNHWGVPLGYWRPAKAWLQAFYIRDNWYEYPEHEPVQFTYTDADGQQNQYVAKAAIVDGCWSVEVAKINPAQWGDQEIEFGNHDRLVQVTLHDASAVIETTEDDLERMLIPPTAGMTPEALEAAKRQAGCDFPRARLFKWEQPSPGEVLYEMEGIAPVFASNALARPRLYSWRLRDDRSKLMAMAVRKLEQANDLQVRGSLLIRGRVNDLAGGLGYVDYPDKARAAVVKVTYSFNRGFATTLELTRIEARPGEMPPDDKLRLTDLARLFREEKAGQAKRRFAEQHPFPHRGGYHRRFIPHPSNPSSHA